MAKLGIEVPIYINLPDNWKDQILERIKADGDWVLVTRCAACRYANEHEKAEDGEDTDGHIECRLLADLRPVPCTYLTMKEDDYCSYGERRDADAEK